MNCNTIRKLIEEADRPGNIPFEAARHTETCESCGRFADERIKLAELLNSTGRVNAPSDFNVVLRRRLRERTNMPSRPFWSRWAFTLRLAGALAVLVCSVILGQWMRHNGSGAAPTRGPVAVVPAPGSSPAKSESQATYPGGTSTQPKAANLVADGHPGPGARFLRARHVNSSISNDAQVGAMPAIDRELRLPADPRAGAAALVLVKGQTSEREVVVQAFSVGAQPVLSLNPVASNSVARAWF